MSDIAELRSHLFETLKGLKDGSIEIDKARAISQVAGTIIDTARVEVDFMRIAGGKGTGFIARPEEDETTPRITKTPTGSLVRDGNVLTHRMK